MLLEIRKPKLSVQTLYQLIPELKYKICKHTNQLLFCQSFKMTSFTNKITRVQIKVTFGYLSILSLQSMHGKQIFSSERQSIYCFISSITVYYLCFPMTLLIRCYSIFNTIFMTKFEHIQRKTFSSIKRRRKIVLCACDQPTK